MSTCCGSIFYVSPEVWFQYYTNACDVWSIGVITFALVTGRFPFDDVDLTKIEEITCHKKLKFRKKEKRLVSKQFRKLIKSMLQKDFEKRITASLAYSSL